MQPSIPLLLEGTKLLINKRCVHQYQSQSLYNDSQDIHILPLPKYHIMTQPVKNTKQYIGKNLMNLPMYIYKTVVFVRPLYSLATFKIDVDMKNADIIRNISMPTYEAVITIHIALLYMAFSTNFHLFLINKSIQYIPAMRKLSHIKFRNFNPSNGLSSKLSSKCSMF